MLLKGLHGALVTLNARPYAARVLNRFYRNFIGVSGF